MEDLDKTLTGPSPDVNTIHPWLLNSPTTSGNFFTSTVRKNPRPKVNMDDSIDDINDITLCPDMPDVDEMNAEIAYGKFLRALYDDCLVDDKVQLEKTEMNIQMVHLVERFQKTMYQLDMTNRRLKDISFVVEQKRLLDLKTQDCSKFYEKIDKSNIQDIMKDLTAAEQGCLDQLETKGVDFGYDKDSGHKQLLDAVTEAIDGLEEIKKQSSLDSTKFQEYQRFEMNLKYLEKVRSELEGLKSKFDAKFPKISEELLKEVSEKIAMMMEDE